MSRRTPKHSSARSATIAAKANGTPPKFPLAPAWVVLAAITIHAVLYSVLSIRKLQMALYTDFDLAIFAHATSQLTRGSLYESIGGMNWLGGHAALNLFLVAPLYAIFKSPVTLLVLQSVALGAGAWPVYTLARQELGTRWVPAILAILYLLHPALGYMNLFEFHPETLATPALIFVISAARRNRLVEMACWAVFAALAREDVSVLLIGLSLWLAIQRPMGQWRFSGALLAIGVVAAIATFGFLMPAMSAGSTDYAPMYDRWGTTTREIVRSALSNPLRVLQELLSTPGDASDSALKRLYYLQMLLPLGFLALMSPLCALTALPILAEHFLSSRLTQHSIVFHYTALVLPSLVSASVIGLGVLTRLLEKRSPLQASRIVAVVVGLVIACSLSANTLFGPIQSLGKLQGISRPQELTQSEYESDLQPYRAAMLRKVPAKVDVVAGFELLSQFSDRVGLHALHHFLAGKYTFSTRPFEIPSEVHAVIGDLGRGSLFKHVDLQTASRWRELLGKNSLKPIGAVQDFVLFARTNGDTVSLCTPAEPTTPLLSPVVYDGEVSLVGSATTGATVRPGELLPLRTYWKRVAETRRLYLSEILIINESNQPISQLWRYLGFTVYPANEWPLGVSMREDYNLIVPMKLTPGKYFVGVRLWWRDNGQGICSASEASAQRNEGFVTVAEFRVVDDRATAH